MIARFAPPLLLLPLAMGCGKTPAEAPGELGELSLFLFEKFDEEGATDELLAGIAQLQLLLDEHDLEGNLDDRTYSLPPLTPEHWGGAKGPSDQDAENQLPVATFGLSRHNLKANIELAAERNHICIESDSTRYYSRSFLSDQSCFLDGSCDVLRTDNEVRKETFIAKVWYDLKKDYRIIEDDEGGRYMLARSWMESTATSDNGNSSWDQMYTLEAWIPDGGQTQRYHAFWSAVTLPIGDGVYQGQVKSGLDEGYQNADNFIDGELCSNDRDRPYDRP